MSSLLLVSTESYIAVEFVVILSDTIFGILTARMRTLPTKITPTTTTSTTTTTILTTPTTSTLTATTTANATTVTPATTAMTMSAKQTAAVPLVCPQNITEYIENADDKIEVKWMMPVSGDYKPIKCVLPIGEHVYKFELHSGVMCHLIISIVGKKEL